MSETTHETDPKMVGVTVVVGAGYYGVSNTVEAAKANFRKFGGRLKHGYIVFEFDDQTEFTGIDDFGRVHYKSTTGEPPNRPKVTEHLPKDAS